MTSSDASGAALEPVAAGPPRRGSLAWRVLLFALAMALVAGVAAPALLYVQLSSQIGGEVERLLARELRAVVADAAARVDGDRLRAVYASGRPDGEDYRQLQGVLRDVQARFGLSTDIYTLHLDAEHTRFGLSCKPDPLLGQRYELTAPMREVFSGAPFASTGVYRDANGWWLSAYAPIKDRGGSVVALVEADHDLGAYIADTRARVTRSALVALGLGIALAMGLGLLLVRRLVRPLRRLTDAAERISQGQLDDIRLDIHGRDEVGRLAESFERAIASIRYYAARVDEMEKREGG